MITEVKVDQKNHFPFVHQWRQQGFSLRYLSRYYQIISNFLFYRPGTRWSKTKRKDHQLYKNDHDYEDISINLLKICQMVCDEGIGFESQLIISDENLLTSFRHDHQCRQDQQWRSPGIPTLCLCILQNLLNLTGYRRSSVSWTPVSSA